MVRPAFFVVAACLLGGCAKAPEVQEDGGSGAGLAVDVLAAEGHAEGASIIVRVRHADAHFAEAEQLLVDLAGPEHSALVEIEATVGTARQLLHMVLPLWEGLQQASGRLGDSDVWDEAVELLSWAALDAYDALQAADKLLEGSPEMEQLANELAYAFEEVADMVSVMGGSVEYY